MNVCGCKRSVDSKRSVGSILEKEYDHLRAKVAIRAAKYGFIRPDMEDILHDCCIRILEDHILDPDDYKDIISSVIGKYRINRFRTFR